VGRSPKDKHSTRGSVFSSFADRRWVAVSKRRVQVREKPRKNKEVGEVLLELKIEGVGAKREASEEKNSWSEKGTTIQPRSASQTVGGKGFPGSERGSYKGGKRTFTG